ncbi:MAG: hypothetical protein CL911_03110 [Deltaproteobacteria bacterium]|nr:hypothetical protein [Deltaproteobacteria bacterium]
MILESQFRCIRSLQAHPSPRRIERGTALLHAPPPGGASHLNRLSCFGEASRAFHDLPESVKADSTINSAHRGYIAPKSSTTRVSSVTEVRRPNTSESFMRMHEVPASDPRFGNPLQGPNQCPSLATESRWFMATTCFPVATPTTTLGGRVVLRQASLPE